MSIDERLRAIAAGRVDKLATFCAAKKAQRTALETLYYKILKGEFEQVPDEYKEQWLNEQEAKKAV